MRWLITISADTMLGIFAIPRRSPSVSRAYCTTPILPGKWRRVVAVEDPLRDSPILMR